MDRQSSALKRAPGSGQELSRRRIFMGAAGVAAAGAAVLTDATGAKAAALATTVESGAVAPAVVNLTDAATISVDASAGNDFRLTIGLLVVGGGELNLDANNSTEFLPE